MNYIKFVILVYTFFTLIDSSKEDFYDPDATGSDVLSTSFLWPNSTGDDYNFADAQTENEYEGYYLLGFGGYKRPEKNRITFKVYFKCVGEDYYDTLDEELFFNITIYYYNRLRALEEKEEVMVNSIKKTSYNDGRTNYDCEAFINEENKDIKTIISKGDYFYDSVEIYEASTAKNINIAEQIDESLDKWTSDLYHGSISKDGKSFSIIGTIGEEFLEKKLTLILNDENKKKAVPCVVSNDNDICEIKCTPNASISGSYLDNSFCLGNEENLLIHMNNKGEVLSFTTTGVIIKNKKSGGLSAAAYLGIILPLVLVTVATIVTIIICKRRQKIKPKLNHIPHESTVQIGGSETEIKA